MSLLSEVAKTDGVLTREDLISFIKRSNYYAARSNRNYERQYYRLISKLHRFQTLDLQNVFSNNGLWCLKTDSPVPYSEFCRLFVKAWGNRSNNFTGYMTEAFLNNTYSFMRIRKPITLLCDGAIEYIAHFAREIFDNSNPWSTLVYFSKYCSTFLPDLCIPVDTNSLKAIARDYGVKLTGGGTLSDYIHIHAVIKSSVESIIANTFTYSVVEFKHIDDYKGIARVESEHFSLDEVPLNRPIDKIYYSV